MFSLITFVLVALVLLYQGVSALTWVLALGFFVIGASWIWSTPALLLLMYWTLLLAIAVLAFLPNFRQTWLMPRLMRWYKSVLPTLSDTEQQALDAGDVSWDGELFSGNPDWYRLKRIPKPTLTDDEQAFVDGPTEQLCAMLNDWQITQEDLDKYKVEDNLKELITNLIAFNPEERYSLEEVFKSEYFVENKEEIDNLIMKHKFATKKELFDHLFENKKNDRIIILERMVYILNKQLKKTCNYFGWQNNCR